MNIYLVRRTDSGGYDTFDSFVVIADTPLEARRTHPQSSWDIDNKVGSWNGELEDWGSWTSFDNIEVEFIGTAHEEETKRIVCASFNAG